MTWLRIAFPLAAFCAAAVLWLPMRVVWAATPAKQELSIERVDGTVWDGRLADVRWRGHALGDFHAAVSPIALWPAPAISLRGGIGPLRAATVQWSGNATRLQDIELQLPFAQLAPGVSDPSSVHVHDGSVVMDGKACTAASGHVSTDAVSSLGMPAFEGEISCDAGVLTVTLRSKDRLHSLSLELAGQDFSRVTLREATPDVSLALAHLGVARQRQGQMP